MHALEPGHGFVDLTAGASTHVGAFARGEVGWHAKKDLDLFGYGSASTLAGAEAGLGLRWSF